MSRFIGKTPTAETHPGSDFTDAEWEFITAMDKYQRRFRRRYPTWREVLHVARCLGYRKIARPTDVGKPVLDEGVPPTAEELTRMKQIDANESPAA